MRVGWIADEPGYWGGAELTTSEFKAAAPEGIEIVDCPPGNVTFDCDTYVAHNVVHYEIDDLDPLVGSPVTWFHHDLSPWIRKDVKQWLDFHSRHIFCSPLQQSKYGIEGGALIPPPLDLDRFKPTRQIKRHRRGNVTIAGWRNPGKGAQAIIEWARENGPVDVYGNGGFIPGGPDLEYKGEIEPAKVQNVLWRYKTFIFLPTDPEPFCRCVAEAWASGCDVVTNNLVGARYWIENEPDALTTAAQDFWEYVL